MSRIPYHVAMIWPDGKGPRDPALALVPSEKETIAELVRALATLEMPAEESRVKPLYGRGQVYRSFDEDESSEWRDLRSSFDFDRDCVEPDVVRMVLESDVGEARAICRRHILSDDSDKTDAWIVAHLTHCVVAGFIPALVADFDALAIRQIPKLVAQLREDA